MKFSVADSWTRIVQWSQKNWPLWRDGALPPGAGEYVVLETEATIGFSLPSHVREFYLLSNGSGGVELPGCCCLLSLQEIIKERRRHISMESENRNWEVWPTHSDIKPIWWSRKRLQLNSGDASGNYTFLDLDPAATGTYGQIIFRDRLGGPNRVLAKSFGEWLNKIAESAEAGEFE